MHIYSYPNFLESQLVRCRKLLPLLKQHAQSVLFHRVKQVLISRPQAARNLTYDLWRAADTLIASVHNVEAVQDLARGAAKGKGDFHYLELETLPETTILYI